MIHVRFEAITIMLYNDDKQLEQSSVVANCCMNRERDLSGTNGYDIEVGSNRSVIYVTN